MSLYVHRAFNVDGAKAAAVEAEAIRAATNFMLNQEIYRTLVPFSLQLYDAQEDLLAMQVKLSIVEALGSAILSQCVMAARCLAIYFERVKFVCTPPYWNRRRNLRAVLYLQFLWLRNSIILVTRVSSNPRESALTTVILGNGLTTISLSLLSVKHLFFSLFFLLSFICLPAACLMVAHKNIVCCR